MNIDKNSPLPRYYQMQEIIRKIIVDNNMHPGDKLPSESEFTKKYGTSRLTLRRAISELVSEGIIRTERGKGTFVAGPVDLRKTNNYPQASMIGLITPSDDWFSNRILRGVEQIIQANAYQLLVAVSRKNIDKEKEAIRSQRRSGAKGLIIFPSDNDYRGNDTHIAELQNHAFPFVLIDRYLRNLNTDYVVTDNEVGAYKIVTHLIEQGHRRIGFLTESFLCNTASDDRLEGYRRALLDHGLTFEKKLVGRTGETEGGIRSFLRTAKPSGVFCIHDIVAIRTMRIIREEGLRIPDDIAVVGYDDIDVSDHLEVRLTTMRQPLLEIGRTAAAMLFRKINGEVGMEEVQQEVLTSELVVRESSVPIERR